MTDPIEQAREEYVRRLVALEYAEFVGVPAGASEVRAAFSALKQAIRLHDPDVVRLVLAARAALLVLDEILGDTDLDDDESDEFAAYRATDAALVPFKEVQE